MEIEGGCSVNIFGKESPTYYIAGPMTGLPDNNYPAFNEVAKTLWEQGYMVLNPAETKANYPKGADKSEIWRWYMRKAIQQVAAADRIMLLPGWENSIGACVEFNLAKSLGLRIEFWQSPEEKVARAVTSREPKEGQVISAKTYLESLGDEVTAPLYTAKKEGECRYPLCQPDEEQQIKAREAHTMLYGSPGYQTASLADEQVIDITQPLSENTKLPALPTPYRRRGNGLPANFSSSQMREYALAALAAALGGAQ